MQDSCLYFSSSGLQWNVCQKSESLSFFHVLNNRCQVCWLNLVKNKIKLTIQTTVCTCFPVHILVGCNWLLFQSYGSIPLEPKTLSSSPYGLYVLMCLTMSPIVRITALICSQIVHLVIMKLFICMLIWCLGSIINFPGIWLARDRALNLHTCNSPQNLQDLPPQSNVQGQKLWPASYQYN